MSDDGDKQFEPTQQRLDEARKRGEIARSQDFNQFIVFGVFAAIIIFGGDAILRTSGGMLVEMLGELHTLGPKVFADGGQFFLGRYFRSFLLTVAVALIFPGLVLLVGLVAQRSLIFSTQRLVPELNRISLIKGINNKFGAAGLFEFAKSVSRLVVYCVISGVVFWRARELILFAPLYGTWGTINILSHTFQSMILCILVANGVLAMVDFFWQRGAFLRKNRMSRQEMLDEHKQSEGDPHFKQLRRQKAVSVAMNRMLKDIETASVIIVNPTHYAVALAWDPTTKSAPRCVAKGTDEIAFRIRERASAAHVPIRSDPPTARAIFATVEVGEPIRPEHYRAVAAAIRVVQKLRR